MKSRLIQLQFIFFAVFAVTNCTGVETTSRGLENEAYLEFVGKDYTGGVKVIIDNENTFNANVKKKILKRPKGDKYAINPGRHILEVYYNGSLIVKKEILVANQESYRINLP